MPEKIILEDGTEREVPTAQELEDLQNKARAAEKAAELESNVADLQKQLDDYKNQPGAKGMKNLREALKNAKAALKEQNKELDEETGTVIDTKPQTITIDDVQKTASQVVNQTKVQEFINSKISHLDEDSKKVFNEGFKQLVGDKQVAYEDAEKIVNATLGFTGLNATQEEVKASQPTFNTVNSQPHVEEPEFKKNLAKGADIAKALGYQPKKDINDLIK